MTSGWSGGDPGSPEFDPGVVPGPPGASADAAALARLVGDGRYVDATRIGSGRRGSTYRAHRLDGSTVAVKVARRRASASERREFPAAARALAAVRSPDLVPLLDSGVGRDGEAWSVTPWYERGSVADRLSGTAWRVDDVVTAARRAAAALGALHDAGLVHGNVTPANLLCDGDGLMDDGLAGDGVVVDGCALPGLAPHLEAGEAASYVAPEVVGAGAYSAASDVWSLGACMFALLRGRAPWADAVGKGAVDYLLAVSTKAPAITRRADVPAWLDDIVTACLEVDPADRPASAIELAARLAEEGGGLSRLATSAGLPALGAVADGRPLGSSYVLFEPIGSGTTGQVWRGERRRDHLTVAVKLLRPELSSEPEAVARFLRERTTLVGLTHPNLVSVLDMVAEGSTLGIVMDFVAGKDLRKVLSERGPLPAGEAVELVGQIAAGVRAMHDAGLVHRDLKPENVLVEPGGKARVTDFGLARAINASALTRTEQLVGTAEYLAPELVAGRPLTPAADVYSLGVVAYELISGMRPFDADTPAAILRSQLDTPPTRPAGWPDPLWEMVERMLAKDPAGRPSAGGVAAYSAELVGWLESAAGDPRYPRPGEPPRLRAAPGPTASGSAPNSVWAAPPPSAHPGSAAAETDLSLSPLPDAPVPPPDEKAGRARGRRRPLLIGLAALVVLLAGGGGAAAAHFTTAKPKTTELQPYDVTTGVTVARDGAVTVKWKPLDADEFYVTYSTGPVAERTPLSGLLTGHEGTYTAERPTPPGLHCFFAEAFFFGPPPPGIGRQATDVNKECVDVP